MRLEPFWNGLQDRIIILVFGRDWNENVKEEHIRFLTGKQFFELFGISCGYHHFDVGGLAQPINIAVDDSLVIVKYRNPDFVHMQPSIARRLIENLELS